MQLWFYKVSYELVGIWGRENNDITEPAATGI
jgi:hypothetical protein